MHVSELIPGDSQRKPERVTKFQAVYDQKAECVKVIALTNRGQLYICLNPRDENGWESNWIKLEGP